MRFDEQPRTLRFEEEPTRPRWVVPVAILILALGAAVAALIATSAPGVKTTTQIVEARQAHPPPRASSPEAEEAHPGSGSSESTAPVAGGPLGASAQASFDSLSATLPARVGLAIAPVGSSQVEEFGDLREGHAWSSIKVPILVTLMRENGSEGLSSEEASWASAALTASDNEAAADLFGGIEASRGGLSAASAAVSETLAVAGDASTAVATEPPPPGAVSTYGQTEWSLAGSAQFYRSLAAGCLLDESGTEYVKGLMEEVIPEQRWGLGEAGFPSGWRVAMKGGWGPEGSASGPYLVRQSGIVEDGSGALAVAMIAMDESGTYEAGAADLTQVAAWLAGRLHGIPSAQGRACS